ncbi:ABC transporter ATP-binding protein [Acholeplasma equirhinis]|uniref:ABC transporter ATP-binding protein n=1 Tax=Acholeplasma equirhinis TaxID=555393 RepID=UPI00197A9790|nr:ABC transporter ATP-binding protein [Acholeplasma equirhinis]MBN3490023.1 ABC transporter ATP-binding protein [Acholeplasma equirhinis]
MFKTLAKFIVLTFKKKPSFYFLSVLQALIGAARLYIGVYAVKWVIDLVATSQFEEVFRFSLIVVAIQFAMTIVTKVLDQVIRVTTFNLRYLLNQHVTARIMKFEYEKLEDPFYLDLRERAKFAIDNQGVIYQLLNYVTIFISSFISIATLGLVLFMFDAWMIVALLVALILHIVIYNMSNSFQITLTETMMPINRKAGYYLNSLLNVENQKDFRFTNMNKLIHHKTSGFINETTSHISKISLGMSKYEFASDVVNNVLMGFTYIYIAMKAVAKLIPISDFILYTGTTIQLSEQLATVVGNVANLKRNVEWIKPYFTLLAVPLQDELHTGKLPLSAIDTIEFDNVSFKYPKTEQMILKHISFKVNRGEKISVVGLNGAGKTTLVKLLSRFYQPTEGQILINGININAYEYNSYVQKMAAVFQDFKIFSYSIAKNITGNDQDLEGALDAANKVSLSKKLASLKDGIHSNYGKSLYQDGIELSGGEGQKIAIARALYKNSDLIILDEPTAALDPLAEAEIYEHFNDLVKEKTALYISHRMSSSVFCDKVLVINNGEIEDYDKHTNLMKKTNSLYYELFTTQAKNYQS